MTNPASERPGSVAESVAAELDRLSPFVVESARAVYRHAREEIMADVKLLEVTADQLAADNIDLMTELDNLNPEVGT